jgi:Holliday junction resolvase
MISLDLYGEPVPQARARTVRRGNKTITYDPASKLKEGYKWQIRSQYREEPLTVPVAIDILFMMPIPKSTSKTKTAAMANGTIHHMKRPDLDNLEKFLLDVLNDVVLKDDGQVVEMHARKIYSTKPGTYVRIIPMENQTKQTLEDENNTRIGRQRNIP